MLITIFLVDLAKYNINSKRRRKDQSIEQSGGEVRINPFLFRSCPQFSSSFKIQLFYAAPRDPHVGINLCPVCIYRNRTKVQ